MNKRILLLGFVVTFLGLSDGISQNSFRESFIWEKQALADTLLLAAPAVPYFEGAVYEEALPDLPFFHKKYKVPVHGQATVEVLSARYEPLARQPSASDTAIGPDLRFYATALRDRDGAYVRVAFIPIVQQGGSYQRLVEVNFRLNITPSSTAVAARGPQNTESSVLRDGDVYKFAISETGVYRLSYNFLKNDLKIPIDNVDPRTIKLYGNGGGMLPNFSEAERPDDLIENHIVVAGEEDGRFDSGDHITFYGVGPDRWQADTAAGVFNMTKNIYDEQSYYFIKISPGNGARVAAQESLSGTSYTSSEFDDYARFEQDRVNLLHAWGVLENKAEGAGQSWYGDWFKTARDYTYNNVFNFPNLVPGVPARLRVRMVLRANVASSFRVELGGTTYTSNPAGAVSPLVGQGDTNTAYAREAMLNAAINLSGPQVSMKVLYPQPASSLPTEGWLDFIQMNVRRQLAMAGNQMAFRDLRSLDAPRTTFRLASAPDNILVWDITDPLRPRRQNVTRNGTEQTFGAATDVLREFVAFHNTNGFLAAKAIGKIENQNLHGITDADLVIVYHKDLEAQAAQLAQHRNSHSNFNVALARIDQVYNEFSSGAKDPTAIRDMMRMVYDRSPNLRYLTLFGDGSFDFREIYGLGNNLVPCYETESLNPLDAFPADDYFGILYSANPANILGGDLNIRVGRLPVTTTAQAAAAVNKIIGYDTSPATLRDWRNRLTFVADDEDSSGHLVDSDVAANIVKNNFYNFNIDKLYLDAFQQVSTSAEDRYPDVNDAINRAMFKGVLAMTYLGHGGPKGWAQERVLTIPDILSWSNRDHLPLFITATCSFTSFDNPRELSAGEEVFLNPNGGAIALLTTTRAVYQSQNAQLTNATLRELFARPAQQRRTIGDAMTASKNLLVQSFTRTNSRKFVIIGDPATTLATPQHKVATVSINGRPVSEGLPDTLRAMQKVTIEGMVTGQNDELLSNFNGIVYPTIFDKLVTLSTLGQDPGSPVKNFQLRKSVVFRGRASVVNGRFTFTFVVPRDINFAFGNGKVSYYASDESQMTDAAGYYSNIIIGGTDPNALADDQGPLVEVFMNNESFVFGGITDASPTLLVKLEDDFGINVAGNSIGHDLEGILDDNTQRTFILNDFYEAALDDYTKGEVRYPLSRLAEGRHTMRVKAWDVANNSSEGYTEFIVAPSGQVALQRVLNYPNPFTDRTCFQFDHNLYAQDLDVLIQIFTISGRLVKTLNETVFSDGAIRLDNCIAWDGRDDFGDLLGRGVYLYKVKVRGTGATELKGESDFEKLVILK